MRSKRVITRSTLPSTAGGRKLKADGADGACRIGTDAGQPKNFCMGIWKLAAIFSHDLLCSFFEIADPGIVAKSLPELLK